MNVLRLFTEVSCFSDYRTALQATKTTRCRTVVEKKNYWNIFIKSIDVAARVVVSIHDCAILIAVNNLTNALNSAATMAHLCLELSRSIYFSVEEMKNLFIFFNVDFLKLHLLILDFILFFFRWCSVVLRSLLNILYNISISLKNTNFV